MLASAQAAGDLLIDVEGGQATLVVSPSGESMLIDAGFPGARDARRIAAAAITAGVKQIDYFVNTHFHLDHFGSIPDLTTLMPVRTFVDSGEIAETGKQSVAAFQTYTGFRQKGRHLVVKAGDRVPIAGLDVQVVIAAGTPIAQPQSGGGAANPLCRDIKRRGRPHRRRALGGRPRLARPIPDDRPGRSPPGIRKTSSPARTTGSARWISTCRPGRAERIRIAALVHALRPRVAINNNAGRKGASREHFLTMKTSPGIQDVWQLHYSLPRAGVCVVETTDPGGPELNTSED